MNPSLALAYLRQKHFGKPSVPAKLIGRKTYSVRLISRQLNQQKRNLRIVGQDVPETPDYWRPKTYEDCKMLPRPCPYVGCRYHLLLDETDQGGFKTYDSLDALEKMKYTCALDAANEGPKTLEEVGDMMHLTRERARQIEADALVSFNEVAKVLLETPVPDAA